MAREWTQQSLEHCMVAIIDYRGKTPKKMPLGIPLITAKVVKGGRIETPREFIAEDDYESWMRRGMPERGDVVITTEAPLGEVAQLGGERVALAQRLIALRGRPGILDNTFLKFLMQSENVQHQLRARASGTTVLGIKQSELRKIMLTLPSFDEQRVIANILGTLDDKIELNRRMNETLEGMARALFKSWFVDFDPVRAKAEGRHPGLPKTLADLFPNTFEPSELGPIPKGWHVKRICDIASSLQYGLTTSARTQPVGPQFLRITDIQGGRVDWAKVPYCEATVGECERYQLKPHDIVVARTGASTGENLYISVAPNAVFASYLVRFQFNDHGVARMVGAFMRTGVYFEYVANSIGGSAQPNASARVLAGAILAIPSQAVIDKFADFVRPLDLKIAANDRESTVLAGLRDALLPKLISGELRIPDAEKLVEAQV